MSKPKQFSNEFDVLHSMSNTPWIGEYSASQAVELSS